MTLVQDDSQFRGAAALLKLDFFTASSRCLVPLFLHLSKHLSMVVIYFDSLPTTRCSVGCKP